MDSVVGISYFGGFAREMLEYLAEDGCTEATDLLSLTNRQVLREVEISQFIEVTWRNEVEQKLMELENLLMNNHQGQEERVSLNLDECSRKLMKICKILEIYSYWLHPSILEPLHLDLGSNTVRLCHAIAKTLVIRDFLITISQHGA